MFAIEIQKTEQTDNKLKIKKTILMACYDMIIKRLLFILCSASLIGCGSRETMPSQKESNDDTISAESNFVLDSLISISKRDSIAISAADSLITGTAIREISYEADSVENRILDSMQCKMKIRRLAREKEQWWIDILDTITMPEDTAKYFGGKPEENIFVYFKYDIKVNGYTVMCKFFSWGETWETGRMITMFRKGKKAFFYIDESITTNFYISELSFSNGWKWKNGSVYELGYIAPKSKMDGDWFGNKLNPLGYNTPFQFYDADFDGEKELLINGYDRHQQGNSWDVCKIGKSEILKSEFNPPLLIDNLTEFYPSEKRIVSYTHSGVFYSKFEHYKKYGDKFLLDAVKEYEGDTLRIFRRRKDSLKLEKTILLNRMEKNTIWDKSDLRIEK